MSTEGKLETRGFRREKEGHLGAEQVKGHTETFFEVRRGVTSFFFLGGRGG